MTQKRSYGSASLNQDGNLWMIGGSSDKEDGISTEIYGYKPKGNGRWKKGPTFPRNYGYSGIDSQCTVKYVIYLDFRVNILLIQNGVLPLTTAYHNIQFN